MAQAALWCVLSVFVVHAPIRIVELGDGRWLAGVRIAAYSLANGGGAFLAGRAMDRLGRKPPLTAGHALVLLGVAGTGLVAGRTVPTLLLATVTLGAGAGAALLGRLAVGEMYERDVRGKAIGLVLLAGTVGAVGAPPWRPSG